MISNASEVVLLIYFLVPLPEATEPSLDTNPHLHIIFFESIKSAISAILTMSLHWTRDLYILDWKILEQLGLAVEKRSIDCFEEMCRNAPGYHHLWFRTIRCRDQCPRPPALPLPLYAQRARRATCALSLEVNTGTLRSAGASVTDSVLDIKDMVNQSTFKREVKRAFRRRARVQHLKLGRGQYWIPQSSSGLLRCVSQWQKRKSLPELLDRNYSLLSLLHLSSHDLETHLAPVIKNGCLVCGAAMCALHFFFAQTFLLHNKKSAKGSPSRTGRGPFQIDGRALRIDKPILSG
ncbi:hypothetical protein B0H12DRAFT_726198 [Mycena haematopus]|nr:hypothetical protein B0H12DRAFT_726198 [Mycena haematopus]